MENFQNKSGRDYMLEYGFIHIGRIISPDPLTFSIEITPQEVLKWEKAVYIFIFANKITRIGSSKGLLGKRMNQWSRDITNALRKLNGLDSQHTNTPEEEAVKWQALLRQHGHGEVFAREATEVITPVGRFRAYMDEESILINRHKPPLNRHTNR